MQSNVTNYSHQIKSRILYLIGSFIWVTWICISDRVPHNPSDPTPYSRMLSRRTYLFLDWMVRLSCFLGRCKCKNVLLRLNIKCLRLGSCLPKHIKKAVPFTLLGTSQRVFMGYVSSILSVKQFTSQNRRDVTWRHEFLNQRRLSNVRSIRTELLNWAWRISGSS